MRCTSQACKTVNCEMNFFQVILMTGFTDTGRKFIRRDQWTEKAKDRTKTYTWGGRQEQEMVDEMRKKMAGETV